jgi:SAM-dependent methyltransferase
MKFFRRSSRKVPSLVQDTFWAHHYIRHNQRRLEHLASLGLPLARRRVLELGAGIGDHTTFFLDRDCEVCVSDGRPENVDFLRQRYHWMRVETIDLEQPLTFNESFEIVYCYGLLYHLSDPAGAISKMASLCSDLLLLETCVSPGDELAIKPAAENRMDPSQSLIGRGCRPTRPWIMQNLRECFPHAYVTVTQPWHPEFPLCWDLPLTNGLTRSVFLASRQPLSLPTLSATLLQRQHRHGE